MKTHLAFPALHVTCVVCEIEPAWCIFCQKRKHKKHETTKTIKANKQNTFSTGLTDIRKLVSKDTFIAIQMPLEMYLQSSVIVNFEEKVSYKMLAAKK